MMDGQANEKEEQEGGYKDGKGDWSAILCGLGIAGCSGCRGSLLIGLVQFLLLFLNESDSMILESSSCPSQGQRAGLQQMGSPRNDHSLTLRFVADALQCAFQECASLKRIRTDFQGLTQVCCCFVPP